MTEQEVFTPIFTLQEQRAVIKFFHYGGKSPIDIHREMIKVCPTQLMNVKNIRTWVRKFREGRDSTVSKKPGRKMSLERQGNPKKRRSENPRDDFDSLLQSFLPDFYNELNSHNTRRTRGRRRRKKVSVCVEAPIAEEDIKMDVENVNPSAGMVVSPADTVPEFEAVSGVRFEIPTIDLVQNSNANEDGFINTFNDNQIEFITDINLEEADAASDGRSLVTIDGVPTINYEDYLILSGNCLTWQVS